MKHDLTEVPLDDSTKSIVELNLALVEIMQVAQRVLSASQEAAKMLQDIYQEERKHKTL